MKILYIIDRMINLGGIERILSCKMNYLAADSSCQIFLATYDQQGRPVSYALREEIAYCPFEAPIPERAGLTLLGWIAKLVKARHHFNLQFKKLLTEVKPDIVICTGYAHPVIDIIINSSQRKNIKTIVESHIDSSTVSMSRYVYNHLLSHFFSLWDRHILRSLQNSSCVVTLTCNDAKFWTPYVKRIEVIPNMLTVNPIKVIDYHSKRVVAAGRYVYQKGYDLLFEAWMLIYNRFNDWHLYVFGNEDRAPYQQMVDKLGLNGKVHLLPATHNIVEEFSKSSVYVMSSRFEGFPLVLGEAMSCGLPCVSFDCPHGPRDIITDGVDGILVENGNVKDLAENLERLMADVELRQSMGEQAIRNISRYSPERIMELWKSLFKSL